MRSETTDSNFLQLYGNFKRLFAVKFLVRSDVLVQRRVLL